MSDITKLSNAILSVWDEIGYDVCNLMEEGETLEATHVIEMCVDADRLRIRNPEAYAIWAALPGDFSAKAAAVIDDWGYELFANC